MELVLQRLQRKENVKKYSILYVDDEPVNLRIFQHAFKRYYHVSTALNGFDALEILNEKSVDLVITDQQMPHMSGVDLLAKIVPKHPSIVRMVMTGFSDIGAIIRAVNEFGLDKYLVKPWDRDQLKVEFDKALERKQKEEDSSNASGASDSSEMIGSVLPTIGDLNSAFKDGYIVYDSSPDNRNGYWLGEKDGKSIVAYYNIPESKLSPYVLNSFINLSLTELIYRDSSLSPSKLISQLAEKVFKRFSKQLKKIGKLDIGVAVYDADVSLLSYSGVNQDFYYSDTHGDLKSIKGTEKGLTLDGKEFGLEEIKIKQSSHLFIASKNMIGQIIASDDSEVEGKSFLKFLKDNSLLPLSMQSESISTKMSGDNAKCFLGIQLI